MVLLLGSHVRERAHQVGRLAGFELEPETLRIRRIIYSPDGDLGPQAMTRPLSAIAIPEAASTDHPQDGDQRPRAHDGGEGGAILLQDLQGDDFVLPAVGDVMLLSRATRIKRGRHEQGRFVGASVNPADRSITFVYGRQHLWSRRFAVSASEIDCSTPGEIRVGTPKGDTRAA